MRSTPVQDKVTATEQESRRQPRLRVAVYTDHLRGGGTERVVLHMLGWLVAAGHAVDLLVNDATGRDMARLPESVRVVVLKSASQEWTRLHMLAAARDDACLLRRSVFVSRKQLDRMRYLPALTRYLRRERPTALISHLWQLNLAAISAKALYRRHMPVICVFHSAYFHGVAERRATAKRQGKWRRFIDYCGRVYARADRVVTVSRAQGEELAALLNLPRERLTTIANPVVNDAEPGDNASAPPHPWLAPGEPPTVLAVARLSPEKNLQALIEAFARVEDTSARLIILGEGPDHGALAEHIAVHALSSRVELAGWVDDTSTWYRHAAVFALTSLTEGLPLTLIEAMAAGCHVVSTDCPHGPAEILADGRYGRLVALGDTPALADALTAALADSRAGRDEQAMKRAGAFSVAASRGAYETLFAAAIPFFSGVPEATDL